MLEMNSRSYRVLTTSLIYLVAIAGALTIATLRSRAKAKPADTESPIPPQRDLRPASLIFAFNSPHLWEQRQCTYVGRLSGSRPSRLSCLSGEGPHKFFTDLKDPHQLGKEEEQEVASSVPHRKSFLEKLRGFKRWAYTGIRGFVRGQLQHDSRQAFNQKFRKEADPIRTPLNVSDYARVPLLNPDLLVSSWREPLPPLENEYDQRMIPLGSGRRGLSGGGS